MGEFQYIVIWNLPECVLEKLSLVSEIYEDIRNILGDQCPSHRTPNYCIALQLVSENMYS